MQFGYHTRLERETQRWIKKGIIDQITASSILNESRSRKSGYSFSSIVIMLGVICLCFAAMTFVAANWDEMAKIMRVLLLLAGMAIAYLAAFVSDRRGSPLVGDAFVLLGCGIFGAAIMLVGQMYHLQGKAEDAVLLWAGGSLLAALLLRASTALWLAIALFSLWMGWSYVDLPRFSDLEINYLYLLFWVVCAALAWWLHSRMSAHLLIMAMIFWVFFSVAILTERHDTPAYLGGLYAFLYVVIALAITSNNQGQWLRGAEATIINYMVLCIVGMTALWVAAVSPDLTANSLPNLFANNHLLPMIVMLVAALAILANAANRKLASIYDIAFCAVWIAAATFTISSAGLRIPFLGEAFALAISIWLIRMGSRQDIATVTRLGYLAFAMVMLLLYFRTASTLLGTTGFYLTAGILMVLGAIFLPKLFRSRQKEKEVA